jgi:hypothetical protein
MADRIKMILKEEAKAGRRSAGRKRGRRDRDSEAITRKRPLLTLFYCRRVTGLQSS